MKELPLIEKPYAVGILHISQTKLDMMMGYIFVERAGRGVQTIVEPQKTLEDAARNAFLAYAQGSLETIEGIQRGHFPISKVEYRDAALRRLHIGKGLYLEGLAFPEFCDFKEIIRNMVRLLTVSDDEADYACVVGERALIRGKLGREMGFKQQIAVRGPLGDYVRKINDDKKL